MYTYGTASERCTRRLQFFSPVLLLSRDSQVFLEHFPLLIDSYCEKKEKKENHATQMKPFFDPVIWAKENNT